MIFLLLVAVILIGFDLYADWVTPYLEQVEREHGQMAAWWEAVEILTL